MTQFVNSTPTNRTCSNEFLWLAGLLEAEGTFLKPAPSGLRCPIVSCRMTDRDVIERVSLAFGTSVGANDKGPYRTEYAVTAKGSRAADLMTDLRPFMGSRRRAAIDRALEDYEPAARKLDHPRAEEIRRRHASGETVSSIARCFGVARQTIHPVLDHRIYRNPPSLPWRELSLGLRGATTAGTGLSSRELYWLAGWLEGEGSFLRPPPSDRRRPRIAGTSRDYDVVAEVGRLFKVAPVRKSERRHRPGWSPAWCAVATGRRAVFLMQSLEPLMGARRSQQIDRALNAAQQAGSPAFALTT
jgi:hypothetical protein